MNENNRFSGRLIGALFLAAIGIVMYFAQVQENPVTHERQHVAISPTQEIRLGLQSAPMMAREMGGELRSSDPRYLEVQKIGNYLVQNTIAKGSPWQFQFHVLADEKTINAFALPGGQIFITAGLLKDLENEAQLAGVLSHEMGHVIERHSAQQMATSQLGQSLISAVGVAASDPDNPQRGLSATMIASVVNQMINLRYSRADESEADLWGLKLMTQAGYNPRAMIRVMEILKAADKGGHSIEMFQTHPNPDIRIHDINEYLKKNPPQEGLNDGKAL